MRHESTPSGRPLADPDLRDGKLRERLPMACLAGVAGAALVLVDEDLFGLPVAHRLADDGGVGDERGADGGALLGGDEQNLGQFDGGAGLDRKQFDVDDVPRGDAELFPACTDHGIHDVNPPFGSIGNK